jgi:D-tagatose-1,6-bisphosphate aldolase subunit GatZ/KbaZ
MQKMQNKMMEIIEMRKSGHKGGIYSCCSANSYVIEAAMERGVETNSPVLIESTANQVNQFGGYTDMKPADFIAFVYGIAKKTGFPKDRLILGGDHLGPLIWQDENEAQAMEKSIELLKEYTAAGFTKIHIDTSMRVADDGKNARLSDKTIARRAAILCEAAEQAYKELRAKNPDAPEPVYIIGSEVPIPGGAQENESTVSVTKPEEFHATFEAFKKTFEAHGLHDAFSRVIGVVVQPGVEFGDASVIGYDREAAHSLTAVLQDYNGIFFEGHSTDFQTPEKLKEMVEDGIIILKVGPALTFAMREAVFALNSIEEEVLFNSGTVLSKFTETLEHAMIKNPNNWKKHYHGNETQIRFKRKYSFSDRCRYYFPDDIVQRSLGILINNINSHEIPLNVLEQYLPIQYKHIRDGRLEMKAEAIIKDRVKDTINDYLYATI